MIYQVIAVEEPPPGSRVPWLRKTGTVEADTFAEAACIALEFFAPPSVLLACPCGWVIESARRQYGNTN